jgi:hypothetical protein
MAYIASDNSVREPRRGNLEEIIKAAEKFPMDGIVSYYLRTYRRKKQQR